MALYKIEYWSQREQDEEAKCRHNYVLVCDSDRKLKMYVTNREKFFPEFSTRWKTLESGLDFDIWRRDLKKNILTEWREEHTAGSRDVERFVLVKKATTMLADDILNAQCDNKPYRVYTTY